MIRYNQEKKKLDNQLAGGVSEPPPQLGPTKKPFVTLPDFVSYAKAIDAEEPAPVDAQPILHINQPNAELLRHRLAFAGAKLPALLGLIESYLPEVLEAEGAEETQFLYAGHVELFAKPVLSFWSLLKLQKELERCGYAVWVFPVLDVLQLLINSVWGHELFLLQKDKLEGTKSEEVESEFERRRKELVNRRKTLLKEAMDCVVSLKRGRVAHLCQLFEESSTHSERARAFLAAHLDEMFRLFREVAAEAREARKMEVRGDERKESKLALEKDDGTMKIRSDKDPVESPAIPEPVDPQLESTANTGGGAAAWRCTEVAWDPETWS